MVTAGSIAVREPEKVIKWLQDYGPGKIILGADARKGMIAIQGWQEETALDVQEFVRSWVESGIRRVICTDIDLDGMMKGPSLGLYREMSKDFTFSRKPF